MTKESKKTYVLTGCVLVLVVMFFAGCTTTENVPKDQSTEQIETQVPLSPEGQFAQKLSDALDTGSIEDALVLFDTMPEELRDNLELKQLHASLLLSAGRLDEASALTEELLVAAPGNEDVLILSVMLAKAKGDANGKSEAIKEVLAIDPTNSDANIVLAEEQMLVIILLKTNYF